MRKGAGGQQAGQCGHSSVPDPSQGAELKQNCFVGEPSEDEGEEPPGSLNDLRQGIFVQVAQGGAFNLLQIVEGLHLRVGQQIDFVGRQKSVSLFRADIDALVQPADSDVTGFLLVDRPATCATTIFFPSKIICSISSGTTGVSISPITRSL